MAHAGTKRTLRCQDNDKIKGYNLGSPPRPAHDVSAWTRFLLWGGDLEILGLSARQREKSSVVVGILR